MKIHFLLPLLMTCLLVMSCGQKGDLVRPQEIPKHTQGDTVRLGPHNT